MTDKDRADMLEKRLKHLLKSEYIRSFDEKNPTTKQYKKDIKEADLPLNTLFICDRNKCGNVCNIECAHTRDVRHAYNFKKNGNMFVEE